MPKDWDEMSPWKQEKQVRDIAEQMGVDRSDFEEADRGSQGNFDRDGYFDAISEKMNNNYSVRSGLEAANRYGAEDAPDIKGISNIKEAYETHKYLKGVHEDELGGNKFSSRNDYGNVSKYLNDEDRKRLQQGFTDDLNAMKQSLLDTAAKKRDNSNNNQNQEVELSDELASARSNEEREPSNIYANNNADVSKTDEASDATQAFLAKKTFDVKTGLNLQPSPTNVRNAAAMTTNIYGR